MWVSLLSVALGSLVTLLQYFGLGYFLTGQNFLSARAAINAMNLLAPFLCFGLDNAAPRIVREGSKGSYVWSFLALAVPAATVMMLFAWFDIEWKYSPFLVGIAFSMTVSISLVASNFMRAQGAHNRYFLSVNFFDRFARTMILLVAAVLASDFLHWALIALPAFLLYSFFVVVRSKASRASFELFPRKLIRESFPLMISSVAIIVLTRSPYFAAYALEPPAYTNVTDIVLLFSLFILIPILNIQKIAEVDDVNDQGVAHYLSRRLMLAEVLIVTGYLATMAIGVAIGFLAESDLFEIVMPIGIGMVAVSLLPNFPHLLLLHGHSRKGFTATIIVILATFAAYPAAYFSGLPSAWGFNIAAFIYAGAGIAYSSGSAPTHGSAARVTRTVILSVYILLTINCIDALNLQAALGPLVPKLDSF
jgi:hypothetical protein